MTPPPLLAETEIDGVYCLSATCAKMADAHVTTFSMNKNFDVWNELKKKIHANDDNLPLYAEREVRWCRLGANLGFEIDGAGDGFARPVVVLKRLSRRLCLVVPLTTTLKPGRYHLPLGQIGGRQASAIISQLRVIDTRRLDRQMGVMDDELFRHVRNSIKNML